MEIEDSFFSFVSGIVGHCANLVIDLSAITTGAVNFYFQFLPRNGTVRANETYVTPRRKRN